MKFNVLELKIGSENIELTALGSDIPYRVDAKTFGKRYTIEPVLIHNMDSQERGGTLQAILVNDVLYRPDCK